MRSSFDAKPAAPTGTSSSSASRGPRSAAEIRCTARTGRQPALGKRWRRASPLPPPGRAAPPSTARRARSPAARPRRPAAPRFAPAARPWSCGGELQRHHLLRRRRLRSARDEPDRARRSAPPRHVLGERGEQRERLLDPLHARRHEGARAAAAHQAGRPAPAPSTARRTVTLAQRPSCCAIPRSEGRLSPWPQRAANPRSPPGTARAELQVEAARRRPPRSSRAAKSVIAIAPRHGQRPVEPGALGGGSSRVARASRPANSGPSPPRKHTGSGPSACSRSMRRRDRRLRLGA